jgi:hypothetical protein
MTLIDLITQVRMAALKSQKLATKNLLRKTLSKEHPFHVSSGVPKGHELLSI